MLHAGFQDVRVEPVTLAMEFPSTADCMQYLTDVSPDFAALLSGKSSAQQTAYRQRFAERLQPYAGSGSVRIPNMTLYAAGRR